MYGVWSRGFQTRGRSKRSWTEVVEKDCQAHKLNKEDAMDHSRWGKLKLTIRMGVSGWMFFLVPTHPGSPGQSTVKRLCVCVCSSSSSSSIWPRSVTDFSFTATSSSSSSSGSGTARLVPSSWQSTKAHHSLQWSWCRRRSHCWWTLSLAHYWRRCKYTNIHTYKNGVSGKSTEDTFAG